MNDQSGRCTSCSRAPRDGSVSHTTITFVTRCSNSSEIKRAVVFTRATLWQLCVCLSVCLSVCVCVTSRCSIETDERIELGFGTEASLQLSYTALNGHSGISERVLPSETLSQTPDLCMCVCVWTIVGQLPPDLCIHECAVCACVCLCSCYFSPGLLHVLCSYVLWTLVV